MTLLVENPADVDATVSSTRASKTESDLRNYHDAAESVKHLYREMHTLQTVDFVLAKKAEYRALNHMQMTIWEALEQLDSFIDASDPDVEHGNLYHLFQTAERLRAAHPDHDWLHLVGLLHDLGKIAYLWGEPQWASVGDTFVVGCAFSPKIVYPDTFANNPDLVHPIYSTRNGIYTPGCGIDELHLAWGHDEYMYLVLKENKQCSLPAIGLKVIRYHSFYPWHQQGEYTQFMNGEEDEETLKWVKEFNKFDLYSKADSIPDVERLTPYYKALVDKYCPGVFHF